MTDLPGPCGVRCHWGVFNLAPVALWLEDYSEVKALLEDGGAPV